MVERNRDLFGVLANGEQHYNVSVMGTPLPDSDFDIDCSIGLSQVPSKIFPVPGNSNAPPSAPQTFVVPSPVSVPAAATSPSADSTRAESVDIEGGGEATLDGNGGVGLQRARQTLGRRRTRPPTPRDSSRLNSTDEWVEEETDITERDELGPSTRRTNSGQKRKTASKSTQVISDCIGKFSGTLLEVESRREDRENWRMQILDEVESKRIALDERTVAVEEHRIEIEDKRVSEESQRAKELVGALTSMATTITSLCALKAQQNS
ncbi:hypothetical protein R1flu_015581 [Riccia fluitans]|uniref:Uncharacterized protein n=1 Tax=Riccia fluitans TaxID=41844 RepID=A0ABD1YK75_9MARC